MRKPPELFATKYVWILKHVWLSGGRDSWRYGLHCCCCAGDSDLGRYPPTDADIDWFANQHRH